MTAKLTLYKIPCKEVKGLNQWPESYLGYKLILYKPGLFRLSQYGSNAIVNFLWYITTFGRFRILFLLDKEIVVHYSYITPKIYRFPFMKNNDMQIGPCATNPDYQKKGIFTDVLKLISECYANKSDSIWTYTTLTNLASQKAFERAGFHFFSYANMSLKTKIVRIIS
jgi:hypothetical protein